MFTVCVFIFASLTAVEPVEASCFTTANEKALEPVRAECSRLDKDPLTTCEMQRVGALKYFIRIRQLNGGRDEAPAAVATKPEVTS